MLCYHNHLPMCSRTFGGRLRAQQTVLQCSQRVDRALHTASLPLNYAAARGTPAGQGAESSGPHLTVIEAYDSGRRHIRLEGPAAQHSAKRCSKEDLPKVACWMTLLCLSRFTVTLCVLQALVARFVKENVQQSPPLNIGTNASERYSICII